MLSKISGKKTYLVVGGAIIYAVLGWYIGDLSSQEAVKLVMGFLGLGTLRAGVAKSGR